MLYYRRWLGGWQGIRKSTALDKTMLVLIILHNMVPWGLTSCVGADARIRPRVRLAAKIMAASQQSWLARAVQSPTGALIATRPRNASIDPYNFGEDSYIIGFARIWL